MNGEHAEPGPLLPDRVLRGALVLLGVGALGLAVIIFVEINSILMREPQTQAEAHALAHSAPGLMVGLILGVGGFSLAGGVLLIVAYVNRRPLSAATLVLTSLIGLFVFEWSGLLGFAALIPAILGGYALYEDASGRRPVEFFAHVAALLWLVHLVLFVAYLVDLSYGLYQFLPSITVPLIRRLLSVGALGILVGAGHHRYVGLPVSGATVALAAAIIPLIHLPGIVWATPLEYHILGVKPLGWLLLIVASVAAFIILARPLGGLGRLSRKRRS